MPSPYRCIQCNAQDLSFDYWTQEHLRQGRLLCAQCGQNYDLHMGVLNTLTEPSGRVQSVLADRYRKGLGHGDKAPASGQGDWQDFLVQRVQSLGEYPGFEVHRVNFERLMDRVFRKQAHSRCTFLHLGCYQADYFLKRLIWRKHTVYGCDLNLNMSEDMWVWLESPEDPRFAVSDFAKLPYKEGAFDYVLVTESIARTPEPEKTLKEILRVLKNQGAMLIVSEPLQGLIGSSGGSDAYSYGSLLKNLRKAGFGRRRIYFPEYYYQMISLGRFSGLKRKVLARVLHWLWKIPGLAQFTKHQLLVPAHQLLGLPVTMVAYKPKKAIKDGIFSLFQDVRVEWESGADEPELQDDPMKRLSIRGDVGDRRTDGRDDKGDRRN
ncbi:MAG: class I SAM-dependent methyltransferase [Vampirovibrio sp.]|nr:class I SAM-dependent methyltransferase [Vampirovibrio sp.]